jgi:putative acetyltransferase
MYIRLYQAKDAALLADLYVRSVREIGSRDYTPRQVEAWASLGPTPERLDELSRDGRIRLVAVDNADQPVAFADLQLDGHIQFLYCAPEVAGTGVTSALYDDLENAARQRRINRLYSEASETARGLFLHKGFTVMVRRELEIDGIQIHNYAVEKFLASR